jgi:tyrosyl-tRNA synthetase
MFPPAEQQLELLFRGVDYGDDEFLANMRRELALRLESSRRDARPLTAYVGIDPTGTDLTLGHTVPLRKLRQFQDLGHRAIFVVGDFTALIGDPSDKSAARRQLTAAEVRANAADYVRQAMFVLDESRTEVRYNSEWLGKLRFEDIIQIASNFTVGQFLQRENFSLRHAGGEPIWLHEFFYALMQAYDAVALKTDVQIGGTEQLFNLMAGRKLQEAFGQQPQIPVTLPILVGTDGALRMSKTSHNYVAIADHPEEQFGKTMSVPDSALRNWFDLVTSWTPEAIDALLSDVDAGRIHPMEAKKRLAAEIVELFHGESAVGAARDHFERTVQGAELPDEIPEWRLDSAAGLLDVMASAGLVNSKSEARRLIEQGGVKLDEVRIDDTALVLSPGPMRVLQVGKRRYLRLIP